MKKYIFLILCLLCLYVGGRFYLVWDAPNSDSESRVSLEITRGMTLDQIIQTLEDRELIRDGWVFKWFVWYHGVAHKLQAGEYVIQRNLTFTEITELLQSGKSAEIRVTIPEGSTIAQIDDILTKKSLIQAGEFEACARECDFRFDRDSLEGFLFPSTYFVAPNSFTPRLFISRLYNTFLAQVAPFNEALYASGRSLEEVVIVASMIEREAFGDSPAEKKIISDVIWKRLDEGIHLGIDATTRYELDRWKAPLYTADFESDSPYNTRRSLGLPPTAIANPGLPSLEAAINPTPNEHYYYLHDCSGQIHFGSTLEDHNANKYKVRLPDRDC